MKQPLYIRAAVAISPQHTFGEADRFLQPVEHSADGKLFAVYADYRQYISPVAIRRMSRLIKMAISAAMQCLKDAGITTPDGIITGTGRGSMTDMEQFLLDMIRLEEGALNPTPFIQSTYNSPNGWIALQSKCTCYNQTYVHRGCSLELSMLDAQLLMAEAEGPNNILVGSYDELTSDYYIIKQKTGYWKVPAPDSRALITNSGTPGTIGGEGVSFFAFSNEPDGAHAVVADIEMLQHHTAENIAAVIANMLVRNNLQPAQIDLLLTGMNGDSRRQSFYENALSSFGEAAPVAAFKHLCGEYDTATGFGLWLADYLLKKGVVPGELLVRGMPPATLRHILLINHYFTGSASVMLVMLVDQ